MATNPLLAELNNLSPAAKTALVQAHTQNASAAAAQPPPQQIEPPGAQPKVAPLVAAQKTQANQPAPLMPTLPQAAAPILPPERTTIAAPLRIAAVQKAQTNQPALLMPPMPQSVVPMLSQHVQSAATLAPQPAPLMPPGAQPKVVPLSRPANAASGQPMQSTPPLITAPGTQTKVAPLMAAQSEQANQPRLIQHPASTPFTAAPLSPIAAEQAEQERKERTGSGISQIHSKVEKALPNHPLLGKMLGWGTQIPATLADVSASAVAPEITANLPGTQYHHNKLIAEGQNQLAQGIGNAAQEAQTKQTQQQVADEAGSEPAREQLLAAQAAEEQAKADALKTGKGWKVEFSPGGEPLQVSNGVESYLSGEAGIPQAAQQVLDTAMQNYQTKQNQDLQKQQKPLSKQQADALNAAWDGIAKQYHLPTGQFREGMPSADAAQIASSFNNVIGRGQGQQRIAVQAGNTGSARADKAFQYNNGELDKLSAPVTGLVQRMSTLQTNLGQGTPQADALVAPELLTVMAGGQGSGLRMNEAEISRIVGGRSAWENLKAAAQHWETNPKSANSITTAQRQQIHALVDAVNQKLQAKQQILDNAYENLLDTDDPKEQRRIVADARQQLNAVDSGQGQGSGNGMPPKSVIDSMKEGQYVHGANGSTYQKKGGKLFPVKAR